VSDTLLLPLVALISAVAAVAQTATGSGYGVLAAPLLLLVAPEAVPGPLLVSTLVVMATVVAAHRHALAPRDLLPTAVSAVPGIGVGLVAQWTLPAAVNLLLVGGVVLVGVVASVSGARVPQTSAALGVAGIASGAFTVISASPGPPVSLVYRAEPDRMRATLSAFFFAVSAVSLVPIGLATPESLISTVPLSAALAGGSVVGVLVARPFLRLLSAHTIRAGTLTLCAIAGTTLLVKGALAL
jgi:uncharacterized protein